MTEFESDEDAQLFEDLSGRLREAHRMLGVLAVDSETKAALVRRLIAVTDASKHDLRRASERLDVLLRELADGEPPPT